MRAETAWYSIGSSASGSRSHLDVALLEKPRLMGEDLVDVVQIAELPRDVVESLEPLLISALLQELHHLSID